MILQVESSFDPFHPSGDALYEIPLCQPPDSGPEGLETTPYREVLGLGRIRDLVNNKPALGV
jgi:hypothetical protein